MKVIVFDLDDTLYPESAYVKSGRKAVARAISSRRPGIAESDILAAMDRPGNPFDNIADLGDVNEMVSIYRNHVPDISLPPESAAVLDRLAGDGNIRLALVTDGRTLGQRNKIKALGLERYFDDMDIYISGERGADKHSPDSFVDIMKRYPDADSYTYVGDNPEKDFIHPNRLGWTTIMLRGNDDNIFNQNTDEFPAGNRPQIIIGSLSELL